MGDTENTPFLHGGDLTAARQRFAGAPEPLIDLSTGINPFSYPLPLLPRTLFTRLPDAAATTRLAAVAAQAYCAPDAANVVPAPGTQILLPLVATLVPPGDAVVLGPTYAEHARPLALAGHRVRETPDIADFAKAALAVVVNPNNPDGRLIPRERLLSLAAAKRRKGGLLVVDEAFMDVGPLGYSVAGDVERGSTVVLRSFGKFFGLAGLRLGFAIAARDVATRLAAALGPWAVAGPALAIGTAALADTAWCSAMRRTLEEQARQLDQTLSGAGLATFGGTSLFRFVETSEAYSLFDRLGEAGILVRRFWDHPTWLRFGLSPDAAARGSLRAALSGQSHQR